MGGNGSYIKGMYDNESEREYRTVHDLSKNIKVIELKKRGSHNSMPRTSHTANRVYVIFYKDGSGVKEIARYGKNHELKWVIHTHEHSDKKGIYKEGHVHYWKKGKPTSKYPEDINNHPRLKRLMEKIKMMKT